MQDWGRQAWAEPHGVGQLGVVGGYPEVPDSPSQEKLLGLCCPSPLLLQREAESARKETDPQGRVGQRATWLASNLELGLSLFGASVGLSVQWVSLGEDGGWVGDWI